VHDLGGVPRQAEKGGGLTGNASDAPFSVVGAAALAPDPAIGCKAADMDGSKEGAEYVGHAKDIHHCIVHFYFIVRQRLCH